MHGDQDQPAIKRVGEDTCDQTEQHVGERGCHLHERDEDRRVRMGDEHHCAPTVWNQTPVSPTSAASQRARNELEAALTQTGSRLRSPEKPLLLPCREACSLVPTASLSSGFCHPAEALI